MSQKWPCSIVVQTLTTAITSSYLTISTQKIPLPDELFQQGSCLSNQAPSFRSQHETEGATNWDIVKRGTFPACKVINDCFSLRVSIRNCKYSRFARTKAPLQDGFRHSGRGNHLYPGSTFQDLGCNVRNTLSPDLFGHRFRDQDAIGEMAQDIGLPTPA